LEEDRDKVGKVKRWILDLPEYVPGKSVDEVRRRYGLKDVIKLASNENPYGPSPKVFEVLSSFRNLNLYPSPQEIDELKEGIADYLGVDAGMIAIGSGIDGIIDTVFKMFIEPGDRVVIPIPTFPYYHTISSVYGAKIVDVSRDENFRLKSDAVLSFDDVKLVFICSPNNPTGNSEDVEEVKRIVEGVDGIVFIDEAYAEFSKRNLLELVEYENVIIARTFSKAFGLANLRIGYAVMSEDLRRIYEKVSLPFPVSSIAVKCAMASLEDISYVRKCVRMIIEERERVYRRLAKIVRAYPSDANFIYFESEVQSSILCEELMKRGVIVRDCSTFKGCSRYGVRVTIGKREENDRFLRELENVVSSLQSS